ncbi:probable cytochrome P450 6a14 [Linepithema humile]|uniref:probable cytochrome P450 6a14 n=1 Tax=Linepithema humile TaxID=83485 RepID=UPI000623930B|nr:PREDICTED: probable cytochrome P450 6a14 [Linepithema humile]
MLIEILVTIIITFLIFTYFYHKYVISNFWRKKNVFYVDPSAAKNYMAASFGQVALGEFFRDVYLKYKDHHAFGMCMYFNPMLMVADLDFIRTVLTKDFSNFHDRGMFCDEKHDPLSCNLFNLTGTKWKNLRIKMTPIFTPGKIKQQFPYINEISQRLVKYLEKEAQMKSTIEMKDLFERYTTDVIMSTVFGVNSDCIENPNNEFGHWKRRVIEPSQLRIVLSAYAAKIIKIWQFLSIPITPNDVTNYFINLFQVNMENRKAHNIVKQDFLNLLIQLVDTGYIKSDDVKNTVDMSSIATEKLTMIEGAAQAFIFFIAGYETSATTASNCMYELAQNQDIQDKLRNEIDEIIKKHNGLSYDALNEMTYLHKVINETMRKYPPVPSIHRICTEDTIFPPNIQVSKGTAIIIPVFGLHRDPLIYPDPDKFDPDRFNAEEIAARHPYAYLPFGEGPRICIAAKLGYLQTKIGIINVLSKYKFKLAPQTPVPLTFKSAPIVLRVKDDIHVIIEPR